MKKILSASLVSIVLAVIGVCLLLNPGKFVSWLFYIAGGLSIITAGIKFYSAYKHNTVGRDIVYCTALLTIGVVLVILQAAVLEIIPMVIGICLLVYGLFKLKSAFMFKNVNNKAFTSLLIGAIIGIVLAIIIIACSGLAVDIVLRIIGGIIIYNAVENIFSTIVSGGKPASKKEPIKVTSEEPKDE